jgi:hypothetical protein
MSYAARLAPAAENARPGAEFEQRVGRNRRLRGGARRRSPVEIDGFRRRSGDENHARARAPGDENHAR